MHASPFPPFQRLELLASTPISQTWRVAVADGFAVLREDGPGARHLGLDRATEPEVIRTAAAAGIGPALIAADPGQGRLLTEWLPGRAWQVADFKDAARLHQVGLLLRHLHATPLATPTALPRLDLQRAIERYAVATGDAISIRAVAARAALADCRPLPPADWRFCHNDPTPGNFIVGAGHSLHLIDWEYAGLGDPAFDLAGVASGADLTPEESRHLLGSYLGRAPGPAEVARHEAWQVFCRALAALWLAALDPLRSTG